MVVKQSVKNQKWFLVSQVMFRRAEDEMLISAVQLITRLLKTATEQAAGQTEVSWPSYQCPVYAGLQVFCLLF